MTAMAALLAIFVVPGAAATEDAGTVKIPSVLLKVVEEIEVPAEKAGVLSPLLVREGSSVKQGEAIGQISDSEARIAANKAKLELQIAADKAGNDVNVRFAKKSQAVAEAELKRSQDSVERHPQAVSKTELDRLQLVVERAALEVEQAAHEAAIAEMSRGVKESEFRLAEEEIRRRTITAPAPGVVVNLLRHTGEWVAPGDPVLRLVRVDRLRAEGFLDARYAARELTGTSVRLVMEQDGRQAEFPGRLVFISPEIDPVNGQARIWAEIDNVNMKLRAGMRGTLWVSLERQGSNPGGLSGR